MKTGTDAPGMKRAMLFGGISVLPFGLAGVLAGGIALPAGAQDEDQIDTIAAMVRQHGYACIAPTEMTPDESDSSAEEQAWLIDCENGRFKVKILGDTGAEVTPVL